MILLGEQTAEVDLSLVRAVRVTFETCRHAQGICMTAGRLLHDCKQARQLTAWTLEQRRLDEGRPDKHVANVVDDHTLAGPAATRSLDGGSSTFIGHSSHRKDVDFGQEQTASASG